MHGVEKMAISEVRVALFDKDRIMLVRRKEKSGLPSGGYDLPGGFVEKGEDAKDAAVREVRKGTGLAIPKDGLRKTGEYEFEGAGKVGAKVSLYSCETSYGTLKGGVKTEPSWVFIYDVMQGKYRMPKTGGRLMPEVYKLLYEKHTPSHVIGDAIRR
jgi:predicted NUDIX family NTP pyrophosphohydrolase